jgi:hypothetical protein
MKSGISLAFLAVTLCVALPAYGREDLLKLPIKDALATAKAKELLDGNIKLFFGDQKFPKPTQQLGSFTANKKTNFANKSDVDGCNYVFLSAALALQQRAVKEGGNAVVEIVSVYKNNELKSETEFECGAGTFVGGVALRGRVVKLP